MLQPKDTIEKIYSKYLDIPTKLEFILSRVRDIREMLEDLEHELCVKGYKPEEDTM